MKASILCVSAVLALASAQNEIPKCATGCVANVTTSDGQIGGCDAFDVGCICGSSGLLDSIACCLEDSCDEQGMKDAVSYAKDICSSANVEVPNEVVCKDKASETTAGASQETGGDDDSGAAGMTVPLAMVGAAAAAVFAL